MRKKTFKITIFILIATVLTILAVLFYKWVNYMPSFASWDENDPPYTTEKEFFGTKKYVTYKSDEFENNKEVQELDVFLMDILNSAFDNDGILPEHLEGIVSQDIYISLDKDFGYGIEKGKESEYYETYEIDVPNIIIYKDKAIADFRFYYSLRDRKTDKSKSTGSNRRSPIFNKIYLEKRDGNWYIIDFFALP